MAIQMNQRSVHCPMKVVWRRRHQRRIVPHRNLSPRSSKKKALPFEDGKGEVSSTHIDDCVNDLANMIKVGVNLEHVRLGGFRDGKRTQVRSRHDHVVGFKEDEAIAFAAI